MTLTKIFKYNEGQQKKKLYSTGSQLLYDERTPTHRNSSRGIGRNK